MIRQVWIVASAVLLIGGAGASRQALAAGDGCVRWRQTTATQARLNRCSAEDARRSGREVVNAYLAYRATLAGGRRRALDTTQKAWAEYRDAYCGERGAAVSGGSIQPLVVNECTDTLNRRRVLDIQNDRKP